MIRSLAVAIAFLALSAVADDSNSSVISAPVSLSIRQVGLPQTVSHSERGSRNKKRNAVYDETKEQVWSYAGKVSWLGAVPTNVTLEVYYIGHRVTAKSEGRQIDYVISEETQTYAFEQGGSRSLDVELSSPKIPMRKIIRRRDSRSGNRSRNGSETSVSDLDRTGVSYDGIVVRAKVDGRIARTYVQKARWDKAARCDPFVLDDAIPGNASAAAIPVNQVKKRLGD